MKEQRAARTKNLKVTVSLKEDECLTPADLAKLLKVKPNTVYSWINRGIKIPHVKIGGTLRFREAAINEWVVKQEEKEERKNFGQKGSASRRGRPGLPRQV